MFNSLSFLNSIQDISTPASRKDLESSIEKVQKAEDFLKNKYPDKQIPEDHLNAYYLSVILSRVKHELRTWDLEMNEKEKLEQEYVEEVEKMFIVENVKDELKEAKEEDRPKPYENNIVAIICPIPDWTKKIEDDLEAKYDKQALLLEKDDVVKIRKTFNKNEDEFAESFVNYFLSKIDKKLKEYVNDETLRIEKILGNIRDILRLEIAMTFKEKEKINEELQISFKNMSQTGHVFESDLTKLEEWRILQKLSGFKDLYEREQDNYIMKLGDRLQEDLKMKLKEYSDSATLNIHFSGITMEPLGQLRYYRDSKSDQTEGDYISVYESRKEAYDEDNPTTAYSFTKGTSRNRNSHRLRQRTLKFSVKFNISTIALKNALNLSSQIRVSNGKSTREKTHYKMSFLEKAKFKADKLFS